jgi:hypothetical protein
MIKVMWCQASAPTMMQVEELHIMFPKGLDIVYLKDKSLEMSNALYRKSETREALYELAQEFVNFCCRNDVDFVVKPMGDTAFYYALGRITEEHATAPNLLDIRGDERIVRL